MPEKSSVQVALRIRPLNTRENSTDVITTVNDNTIFITNPDDKKKKTFRYDYLYDMQSTQENIYNDIGKQIVDAAYKGYNGCVFAYGQTGCFAKGTEIMLINGKYKNVEDIVIGDVLMGDDSTPRNVLELFRGRQQMYKIDSFEGGSYVVNEDHIMVFYKIDNKLTIDDSKTNTSIDGYKLIEYNSENIIEMPLKDYLKMNKNKQEQYKLITTSIDFPKCETSEEPYIFGFKCLNSIDDEYKMNSREVRIALINGLNARPDCEVIFDIYDDVIYIMKSLGYTTISNSISTSKKIALHTPFIYKLDIDDYYGFMIDDNHRFIGAGFNVLRNSGKSHTMMGDTNNQGLIPRICQSLFENQTDHNGVPKGDCTITYKVEFSYLEIYSEEVRDLMRKDAPIGGLKVRQHPEYGPYVEGLSQILVEDPRTIKKLIEQGNKSRIIASTMMNLKSSRSHAILTLYFTQMIQETDKHREIVSRINLVDLAGSERVETSGVSGINFTEAININQSLSTLGLVISKLAMDSEKKTHITEKKTHAPEKKPTMKPSIKIKPILKHTKINSSGLPGPSGIYPGSNNSSANNSPRNSTMTFATPTHIPFRDSVLTWILKESLGGNSKTYMIATISPSALNYNESLNTLRYAYNAKQIVNIVKINEDPNDKIIRVLKDEIAYLKEQLKGSVNSGASSSDLKILNDKISQREELYSSLEKSWEQKLEESKKMHMLVQEQYKQELAVKQAEFMKKIEQQNNEYQQLINEMELLKYTMNEKELQQQQLIEIELVKAKREYEKKQNEFEKEKIVDTAKSLHEYYEQKLESVRQQYEAKEKQSSSAEINKLKLINQQLKDNLTKTQKDLQSQMKQFTNDRATLSKQIQQLQSKIHGMEQDAIH